jgi:bifunctional oligoribonuclease and PAP phosphatase NrnA
MTETLSLDALLAVPAGRREALAEAARILTDARRVVLTTHVNADADGVGSEAALLAWLREQGVEVSVVNPTPLPDSLRWILPEGAEVLEPDSRAARAAIAAADRVVVLDTSERNRVEPLADLLDPTTTLVIDHHPAGDAVVGEWALQDPSAAATSELIFDLVTLADGDWSEDVVRGIYVALVSDTGSFRYANTSARALAIGARMVALGAEPEPVYHRLFGSAPRRRLELLREALDTFDMEPDTGLSWMVVTREMVERAGAGPDDFEGLIEHVRTLEGTEVAILFTGTEDGVTKVSFRSNGRADVRRIARRFGGGGHVKAAGARVEGRPEEVAARVLAAAREETGAAREG